MLEPEYETRKRKPTEFKRLGNQVTLGWARIGPDAARKIARRIEDQGGFWGPRKMENQS